MASADVASLAGGDLTSHPFTCNTCAVAYRHIDLQRGHMKSDWHRYNLKRRVASLPPITSETFNDKVLNARAVQDAEAEKAVYARTCDACQKTYSSENAYQNHLTSQKHKASLAALERRTDGHHDDTKSVMSSTFSLGDPTAVENDADMDSDAEEEFTAVVEGFKKAKLDDKGAAQQRPSPVKRPSNPQPMADGHEENDDGDETGSAAPKSEIAWSITSCIFCNYNSPTVALNAHHMERFHGMFIPEKQYLTDLEGLLQHLLERVHEGHQCLFCFKVKSTAFAVQTHMRDKGHCKIPFEAEEEQLDIGEFYDFRGTYSDEEEEEDDEDDEEGEGRSKGGAKLGAARATKYKNERGGDVEEGDGWETDSDESSLDSEELTAVPAGHDHQLERLDKHPHHSSQSNRSHRQADGFHSNAHKHTRAVFYDDYELHLPSGKAVGHRSMAKYYRQNLHSYPTPEERADRERLALEEARGDNSSDEGTEVEDGQNGDRRVARTGHGRDGKRSAVMRRDAAGMAGVTDVAKRAVKESEQRGRTSAIKREKFNDYKYGKKANNQKTYYYRYQAGG